MAELTTFGEMISKNQFKFVRQLEQKKYRRREGLFEGGGRSHAAQPAKDALRHQRIPRRQPPTAADGL